MVRNLDLLVSSGVGGRPTMLDPKERANLSHSMPAHLRMETDPVSKTLCYLVF
jgi:hypothetical protein